MLDRAGERLAQATPEVHNRIWAEVARAVLRCDPARALDLLWSASARPSTYPQRLTDVWLADMPIRQTFCGWQS